MISNNRSLLSNADSVLFHIRDMNLSDLPNPSLRNPNQYFVFYLLESPIHTYVDMRKLTNYFNVTMTYRYNIVYTVLVNL